MDELEKELYKKADEYALQLRLDYGFYINKINIFDLCEKLNIKLKKYSSLRKKDKEYLKQKTNDGCSIIKMKNEIYNATIYYNDELVEERIRFTICHELGHIICDFEIPKELEEKIFDHFARELLAPKCSLINKEYNDVFVVSKDYDISIRAASYALKSANNWKMSEFFQYKEQEMEFLNYFKN